MTTVLAPPTVYRFVCYLGEGEHGRIIIGEDRTEALSQALEITPTDGAILEVANGSLIRIIPAES